MRPSSNRRSACRPPHAGRPFRSERPRRLGRRRHRHLSSRCAGVEHSRGAGHAPDWHLNSPARRRTTPTVASHHAIAEFANSVGGDYCARACDHGYANQPESPLARVRAIGGRARLRRGAVARPPHIHVIAGCMWRLSCQYQTLGLGTNVACAPYRHPVVLARLAVDLDHLSDGRLLFGLGAG